MVPAWGPPERVLRGARSRGSWAPALRAVEGLGGEQVASETAALGLGWGLPLG